MKHGIEELKLINRDLTKTNAEFFARVQELESLLENKSPSKEFAPELQHETDKLFQFDCCEIVCDGKDEEEWLQHRSSGVGASEVADAIGHGWGSSVRLWGVKLGLIEPFAGNEKTEWGLLLEPLIAQRLLEDEDFKKEYGSGWILYKNTAMYRSKVYSHQFCTPDFFLVKGDKIINVQIKATGWLDFSEKLPKHVWLQVQDEMFVTGLDETIVAAFSGKDLKLYWHHVKYQHDIMQIICKDVEAFWQKVQTKEQPEPDASQDCTEALNELYPPDEEETEIALPSHLSEVHDELTKIAEQEKEIKDRKTALKNKVLSELKTNQRGTLPQGGGFTYKPNKNGKRTLRRF